MKRRTPNIEQRFLALIAGPPGSIGVRLIRSVLRLASWGYGAAVASRNRLFDLGIRRSHAASVPVISVGNLTTGGTGKTPVVALLVDMLKAGGQEPGIISRGYRELGAGGNDEARVLELLCPGTPHVQNRDRVQAACDVATGVERRVIVADDAFQHRRLRRDLDIVLIDALNPWGHDALLPRGLLREPVSGLRRAHVVMLTRADLVDDAARAGIWKTVRVHRPDAVQVELSFLPVELLDISGNRQPLLSHETGQGSTIASWKDSGVLAFCGIGNPEGFQRTLENAGIRIRELVAFPDHHHYDEADLRELTDKAEESGASALVTTVKDLVKIRAEWIGSRSVMALNIRAQVMSGEAALIESLTRVTQREIR